MKCENCNAPVGYADSEILTCEHCGFQMANPRAAKTETLGSLIAPLWQNADGQGNSFLDVFQKCISKTDAGLTLNTDTVEFRALPDKLQRKLKHMDSATLTMFLGSIFDDD